MADLLASVIPGVSQRADFPIVASKAALLIIDVQNELSTSSSQEKRGQYDDEDDYNKNRYIYDSALPKAMANMAKLIRTMRSLRDTKTDVDTNDNIATMSKGGECGGCEVIFTYLQAATHDNRDISLDYKLSGPKLSTKLPNNVHPAKFDRLPIDLRPQSSTNTTVTVDTGRGDILLPKTSCSVFSSTNLHYLLRNLRIEQLIVCGQLTDQCVLSAVRDGADLGYFVSVVEDACAALSPAEHERGVEGMRGFSRIVSTDCILEELKLEEGTDRGDGCTSSGIGGGSGGGSGDSSDVNIKSNTDANTNTDTGTVPRFTLKTPSSLKSSNDNDRQAEGMAEALLHALQTAGVQFLRYAATDVNNCIRTKAVPIDRILRHYNSNISGVDGNASSGDNNYHLIALSNKVSLAKVCIAGLPTYADVVLPSTKIDSKDVLYVRPDWRTLRVLPYAPRSAMVMGTLHEQMTDGSSGTGQLSEFCTRGMLLRLLDSAKEDLGLGFTVGAEIEFSLLRPAAAAGGSTYGAGNGYEPVDNSLFAHPTILNEREDFIAELYAQLKAQNVAVDLIHAESASGQLELVLPHRGDALRLVDDIGFARETICECAKAHGMQAVFKPKPKSGEAGNGMHVHLSIYDHRSRHQNIFPGTELEEISSIGGAFMEGILRHLPALTAITMASGESFLRVGPGCWTGFDVRWGTEDKEVPLRVCLDLETTTGRMMATNVEFKLLDHTANIYLALAAILRAGIDGICGDMKLRQASDSSNDEAQGSVPLPTSLDESLDCLQVDDVLMDLLGDGLSTSYIAVKRAEYQHFLKLL